MDTKVFREKLIKLADWTGVKWVDGPDVPTGWFENAEGKRSRLLCLADLLHGIEGAKLMVCEALRDVAPEEKKHVSEN